MMTAALVADTAAAASGAVRAAAIFAVAASSCACAARKASRCGPASVGSVVQIHFGIARPSVPKSNSIDPGSDGQSAASRLSASANCSPLSRRVSGPVKANVLSPSFGPSTLGSAYAREVRIARSVRFMSHLDAMRSVASQSSSSGLHAGLSISSSGSTRPRPSSRAHRRFTSVRASRPFLSDVSNSASRFVRSALGRPAAIVPISG